MCVHKDNAVCQKCEQILNVLNESLCMLKHDNKDSQQI